MRLFMNDRGSVLLTMLLVAAVLMLLGGALLQLSLTEYQISANDEKAIQALYLADAGVNRAVRQLQINPGWRAGFSNFPLGPGEVSSVTLEQIGTELKIISTGRVGNARQQVEAVLRFWPGEVFNYMLVSGSSGEFNNSTINGNIYYLGDLEVKSNSKIYGNVYVDGDLSNGGDIFGYAKVSGKVDNDKHAQIRDGYEEGAVLPELEIPEIDLDYYLAAADLILTPENGEEVIFAPDFNGVIFVQGDLQISGRYSGKMLIVCAGDVFIANDLTRQSIDDSLTVMASGDIRVKSGNTRIEGIFFSEEEFIANGNLSVLGSIISNEIDLRNNKIDIKYDIDMISNQAGYLPGSRWEVLSWRTLP